MLYTKFSNVNIIRNVIKFFIHTHIKSLHSTRQLHIPSLVYLPTPPKTYLLVTASRNRGRPVFNLPGKDGNDASMPAGKLFPSFMVLFTKEYLPTSALCFLLLTFQL
jgi:hypothetical protein